MELTQLQISKILSNTTNSSEGFISSVIMNSVDSISNCKIIIFFCRTHILVFEENSFCCIFQIEVQ